MHFNEIADAYDDFSEAYDDYYSNPLFLEEDKFITRLLHHYGCLSGSVLDLGCGTGTFVPHIAKYVTKENYLGVDISPRMIEISRRKYPEYTFVTNPSGIQFADSSFDSVICLNGVVNYPDDVLLLPSEIIRVLKPGGRCFVMSYNVGRTLRPWATPAKPYFYNRSILLSLLKGLSCEACFGYEFYKFARLNTPRFLVQPALVLETLFDRVTGFKYSDLASYSIFVGVKK